MIKNPDPRVKWAMQIMDQEGEVCTLVSTLGWVVCSRGLKSCSYFERFDINKLFVSGVHWNGWPCLHSIHLWNPPCCTQWYQERFEQGSSEVLTIFVYKIFWDVENMCLQYFVWLFCKDKPGKCNLGRPNLAGCWVLVCRLDEEKVRRNINLLKLFISLYVNSELPRRMLWWSTISSPIPNTFLNLRRCS